MQNSKGRILFADNNLDTCDMVSIVLNDAGYEVNLAGSLTEGLRQAKKGGFDLILIDWHFEDGTGIELCQLIRTYDTNTPILFYTGMAFDSDIAKAMKVGAQGYLVKPVAVETLLQALSGYVSGDEDEGEKQD